jgi:hypothetical protein
MALLKASPSGAAFANGRLLLLGADDTIGSIVPGPAEGSMSDGMVSLGGATQAGTSGRLLVNRGFPVGVDAVQPAAGTAYNTSIAATNVEGALLGPAAFPASDAQPGGTLYPGRLNLAGRTLRVRAYGSIANTLTPNLTIAILLGSTVVATTGVQATATITGTTLWKLDAEITCRTTGATGTLMSSGLFTYFTTAITALHWQLTNPTPFTAVTADLTVAQALHLQATWGTNAAANSLTVHQFIGEVSF